MKENYIAPQVDIVKFKTNDVIITSGDNGFDEDFDKG